MSFNPQQANATAQRTGALIMLLLVAFLVSSFLVGGGGCKRIDAGQVGVRYNAWNGSQVSVLQPRIEFYFPWDRLITYPSSLMTSSFVRSSNDGDRMGDDSVSAQTNSGTQVNLDVSISWRVNPENIDKVFKNFGEKNTNEIKEMYLRPLTYAATTSVVGTMSVEEVLVQRRGELNQLIREELSRATGPLGITIDDVNVGEVYPHPDVKAAIDQLVETRNKLQLIARQEQTAREEAKKIITEAEAKAAEANLLSQIGDKALINRRQEIRRIRAQRWNGSEAAVGPKPIKQ